MPFEKAERLQRVPPSTVWSEFTPLANEYKAINLGQGFPSFSPPEFVVKAGVDVMTSPEPLDHQYCRPLGHLKLANVLQKRYASRLQRPDLSINEIIVTNGTTHALNCTAQSVINHGDEVIIIEPFFDLYQNDIEMAGGVCRIVGMKDNRETAAGWEVDWEELEGAINDKTKMILVNTPQNVPGKIWSREDMLRVADLAVKHDLVVISDEVYEELVYDGIEHTHMASLPGMWERTITCASVGKTFSCTGWKIGWCIAPANIVAALSQTHAHQVFSVATPLQIAVADCLTAMETNGYGDQLRREYVQRRELLCGVLRAAGLPVVVPQGSFFILADISGVDESKFVDPNDTTDVAKDWQFCRWLTKAVGVAAIPCTAFCRRSSRKQFEKYVRFAFCKPEEHIEEAGRRMLKLKE